MEELDEALKLIQEEMRKEFGKDSKLEDGDRVVGVFKDCVIIIENDDANIKVDVIIGNPYKFDLSIFNEESESNVKD